MTELRIEENKIYRTSTDRLVLIHITDSRGIHYFDLTLESKGNLVRKSISTPFNFFKQEIITINDLNDDEIEYLSKSQKLQQEGGKLPKDIRILLRSITENRFRKSIKPKKLINLDRDTEIIPIENKKSDKPNNNAKTRGTKREEEFFKDKDELEKCLDVLKKILIEDTTTVGCFHRIDAGHSDGDNKTYGEELRVKANNEFRKNYPNILVNIGSSIRGDGYLEDAYRFIMDIKGYHEIQSGMHFPKDLVVDEYSKTMDSNLSYLFQILKYYPNIFDFNTIEDVSILRKLSEIVLSKNTIKLDELSLLYNKPTKLGTFTNDDFKKIVKTYELGYAWKEAELEPYKVFVHSLSTYVDKEVRLFDIDSMSFNDISLYFYVDKETKYLYLYFYDKDECIYVLSQRSDLSTNCAFIKSDKITLIGEYLHDHKIEMEIN